MGTSKEQIVRAIEFTPGEPLRKDAARNCYGWNSIDDMVSNEYPQATPVAPLVVGQWPIGPRYFKCEDRDGIDHILAVWEE